MILLVPVDWERRIMIWTGLYQIVARHGMIQSSPRRRTSPVSILEISISIPRKKKKKKKIHFHYTLYKKGYPIDQACYIYLTKPEEHHELILLACSSKKHKRKRQKSPSLPNTYVFILYVCRCIHPLAMHVCAFSFCYSLRPPADSWYQNYTKCHRHRTRGIPIHCDEEGKPRPKKIRSKKEKNKTKKGRSVIILR